MGGALALAKSEWEMRQELGETRTLAVAPAFSKPDRPVVPFAERFVPEREEVDVGFGVRARDNMGLEGEAANSAWRARMLDENGQLRPSTVALAPTMERTHAWRPTPLDQQLLVGKEYAEKLEVKARGEMQATLAAARSEWLTRTSASVDPTPGGLAGIGEEGAAGSALVERRYRTVARAPEMERRAGPRVLPERFVERQRQDELNMIKGRTLMGSTLAGAKDEWKERGGGAAVKSNWSYSGLAGKAAPVWNSATGKWERRAFGVAATGSTTASRVAEVLGAEYRDGHVGDGKTKTASRDELATALTQARERWKKERAKNGLTTKAAAPSMIQKVEAQNLLIYGSGSAI